LWHLLACTFPVSRRCSSLGKSRVARRRNWGGQARIRLLISDHESFTSPKTASVLECLDVREVSAQYWRLLFHTLRAPSIHGIFLAPFGSEGIGSRSHGGFRSSLYEGSLSNHLMPPRRLPRAPPSGCTGSCLHLLEPLRSHPMSARFVDHSQRGLLLQWIFMPTLFYFVRKLKVQDAGGQDKGRRKEGRMIERSTEAVE
jgi:hypothetical protein